MWGVELVREGPQGQGKHIRGDMGQKDLEECVRVLLPCSFLSPTLSCLPISFFLSQLASKWLLDGGKE